MTAPFDKKQNLTVKLSRQTIQRAKLLAARRSTSVSALVSAEIERLLGADEAYGRAERQALALLERGFHLGNQKRPDRDELHGR